MPSYTEPGLLTSAGKYASLFDGLPADVAGVARIAQGLLIHEFLAHEYGVTLTDESRATVHLRPVEAMLDAVVSVDDRPLDQPRPPERRVATNCRGFTVLTVAMLRARGVPARARCGFGNYFVGGFHEDHWVAEWYDAEQNRWRLADAQLDEKQRRLAELTREPSVDALSRFLRDDERVRVPDTVFNALRQRPEPLR